MKKIIKKTSSGEEIYSEDILDCSSRTIVKRKSEQALSFLIRVDDGRGGGMYKWRSAEALTEGFTSFSFTDVSYAIDQALDEGYEVFMANGLLDLARLIFYRRGNIRI